MNMEIERVLEDQEYKVLRQEIGALLEGERSAGRRVVEQERVRTYWEVGGRLHAVMPAQREAGYGRQILQRLAADLDIRERLLYEMWQLFRAFKILPTSAILDWSHYRALLNVGDPAARAFYLDEAMQGVRTDMGTKGDKGTRGRSGRPGSVPRGAQRVGEAGAIHVSGRGGTGGGRGHAVDGDRLRVRHLGAAEAAAAGDRRARAVPGGGDAGAGVGGAADRRGTAGAGAHGAAG